MTNERGVKLDRNGYAPSIIPGHDERRCFLCGRNGAADHLDRHEVFGGANRQRSKADGLWVHLCHASCHQGDGGVHSSVKLSRALQAKAQRCAMRAYGWTVDDFRARYRNNYIDEEQK